MTSSVRTAVANASFKTACLHDHEPEEHQRHEPRMKHTSFHMLLPCIVMSHTHALL